MEFVRNMLNEQRKRLVGTLMQHLEAQVYPHLNDRERHDLRKKVLAATSSYHDICLDLLKASVNDGSMVNDEAIRLLARLNTEVRALTRAHEERT